MIMNIMRMVMMRIRKKKMMTKLIMMAIIIMIYSLSISLSTQSHHQQWFLHGIIDQVLDIIVNTTSIIISISYYNYYH